MITFGSCFSGIQSVGSAFENVLGRGARTFTGNYCWAPIELEAFAVE